MSDVSRIRAACLARCPKERPRQPFRMRQRTRSGTLLSLARFFSGLIGFTQ
jgi:hypothetical protein